jgi:hypothetical protein
MQHGISIHALSLTTTLFLSVTKFSLLQLRWLVAVSGSSVETGTKDSSAATTSSTPVFAVIPEWLAKLPAQWISHVAMTTPRLLRLADAEDAVKYATELLRACSATHGPDGGAAQSQLSPPVLTQLIRIPGGFVRAGVARARQREAARNRRPRRTANAEDDDDAIVDDRNLDIYSSFDADDHGVTALTNEVSEFILFAAFCLWEIT